MDKNGKGHPMILDYEAPYDPDIRSFVDQEEVIYEIVSQA